MMNINDKGQWKVTSQVLGDTRKYAVCRVINTEEVEHNGNREYTDHGYMVDKEEALAIAEQLNSQEAQIFPTA